MYFFLALFVALAVLGPLFGRDSRDGLDWAPDHFWRRRRTERRASRTRNRVRRRDSPARTSEARAVEDVCRTVPAAG
ncbi:hypothetical protein DFJ69_3919 [Thermomonospora umbrina]|uniref:Uncharacterized protein n=1 Tax=Thermomonospora umbrina TaxID=111806 RepID=A0A3D9SVA3_9ACTN|nr:hypothetical protein DFJ69_3919 [Thermomonospora umbrina]